MESTVPILATKCPECGFKPSIKISTTKLQELGGLSGVATICDIHGIYDKEGAHIRVLYVDLNGMVRAQNVIKIIIGYEDAELIKNSGRPKAKEATPTGQLII